MLAHTASHTKEDFSLLLTAHIYSVCPTAIPTLPTPAPGCNETELMESLGMQKDKKGEYETFDRFLARTEGLISIVAEIMSSTPADHSLFGGHNGAIIWLERFLDLLPPDQSPLPLLTAPVLVAFLTAAGHLLANKFPLKFNPIYDTIFNDISKRLDQSAIGQPSATRLLKLLSNGFNGFKATLPPGAIREFYDTTTPSPSNSISASAQPREQGQSAPLQTQPSLGVPSNPAENIQPAPTQTNSFAVPMAAPTAPFGGGFTSSATAMDNNSGPSNAFGVTGGKDPSPFGGTAAPAPFGNMQAAPAPSPFGGGRNATSTAPTPPPFGVSQAAPAPSPFGGMNDSAAAPSPFGNTQVAPEPSPFGGGMNTDVAAPSPFGNTQVAPAPSPFGGGVNMNAAAPSPFGNTQAAPAPSPFGGDMNNSAAAPSPFGNTQAAPAPSPFGGGMNMNAAAPSPFGNTQSAPAPSPFGTTQAAPAPSPFGGAPSAASPFPNTQCIPAASPFGGGAPATTGFGFGLAPASAQPTSTPFGGNGNNARSSNKPPCKFFAQGRCTKGDNCNFSHVMPGQGQGNAPKSTSFNGGGWNQPQRNNNASGGSSYKPPCKFFAQGNCRFGDQCKFSHEIPSQGGGGFGGNKNSGFGSTGRPW